MARPFRSTIEAFFDDAELNPNASLIKGVICGYRVEEIEDPLTQQARYMDKLIDELAKGKKMEKRKLAKVSSTPLNTDQTSLLNVRLKS